MKNDSFHKLTMYINKKCTEYIPWKNVGPKSLVPQNMIT